MQPVENGTEQEQPQAAPVGTRVYAWGSAETDQFPMPDPERFESRRPVPIDDFLRLQVRIRSIACGSQHTVFLSTQGHVYTMGSGDEGQLGREGTEATPVNRPAKVELPYLCDMITAGEAHSTAANSLNGIMYTWGVFRNTQGNMTSPVRVPVRTGLRDFHGKKFQKVLSGNNHVMVLTTDSKLYVWGDNETYVLGRMPRAPTRVKGSETTATPVLPIEIVALRGIKDIFTGGYHCFAITQQKVRGEETQKETLYSWGKNNWGQLGIGNEDNTFTPTEVTALGGKKITRIVGGEDHTIFLLDDGSIYGCGRNDDFQLGPISNDEIPFTDEEKAQLASRPPPQEGEQTAQTIENRRNDTVNLPIKIHFEHPVSNIFANNHYSIVATPSNAFFSWGCGMSYVLGNGKDDEVREPHPIAAHFFTGAPITQLSLGSNHVVYAGGETFFEQLPIEFNLAKVQQPRQRAFIKPETDSVHSLLEQRLQQKAKDEQGRKQLLKVEKEAAEQAAKELAKQNGAQSPSERSPSPAAQPEEDKQPKAKAKVQRKQPTKPVKRSSKADQSKSKSKRGVSNDTKGKSKSVNKQSGSAKKAIKKGKASRSASKKQVKPAKANGKLATRPTEAAAHVETPQTAAN